MECQLPSVKPDGEFPRFPSGTHAMPTNQFFCVICGAALQTPEDATADVMKCHACARQVPVPRLVNAIGRDTGCPPAFAPEVLALEVKFLCTACRSPLRADARWEERRVVCPVCGDKISVPRWSNAPRWPAPDETPPAIPMTARLSADEIDFLSTPAAAAPGAVT